MGSCVLRARSASSIVERSLHHFDGTRYALIAFVVMPNHVHTLFAIAPSRTLDGVIKSWKGFTAREINRLLGRRGALWQEDYWDRISRNSADLENTIEYIRKNPVKARLSDGEYVLYVRPSEGGFSNPPFGSDEDGGLENPPSEEETK